MKKVKKIFFMPAASMMLLTGLLLTQRLQAEDAFDYSDRAKNRTYLGGAEESDLKVLPESYFLKNKKNSTEEVSEGF